MKRNLEIIFHILVWACIFLWLRGRVASHIHYVDGIKHIGYFISTNDHIWFWRMLVILWNASFFYVNVYWIFPRFQHNPSRKAITGALILHTAGTMLLELLTVLLLYTYLSAQASGGSYLAFEYRFVDAQLIPYALLLVFSYGYWASKQWLLHYKYLTQSHRKAAELQVIKNQINPHFLFNTLNNLFGMAIEKEAMNLAESISRLTNMMRYTIYENQTPFVSLAKEIDYIQNYIHLQELRFTEGEVPINMTIRGEPDAVYIAPLLLITFIENAFKHGISFQKKSFIYIHLEVQEQQIVCTVENTIHRQTGSIHSYYSGLGLRSARKLLELLYPNQHQLQIREDGQLYSVQLSLPVKLQKQESIIKSLSQ